MAIVEERLVHAVAKQDDIVREQAEESARGVLAADILADDGETGTAARADEKSLDLLGQGDGAGCWLDRQADCSDSTCLMRARHG